jgi:hypothetical protein
MNHVYRVFESKGLAAQAKAANDFGQFAKDKTAFCLLVQAEFCLPRGSHNPDMTIQSFARARFEGPQRGGHMEIAKKIVQGEPNCPTGMELFVKTGIIEHCLPGLVHVLLTVNGKAQVFTSFLTGASVNMQRKLFLDEDIKEYEGPIDEPLHHSNAACAYCLATTRTECFLCNHPDCVSKWARKLKKCGGCKAVFYCSAKCQRADWERGHIVACKVFQWLSPLVKINKPDKHKVLECYCSWMEAKALERGENFKLHYIRDATKDPKSRMFGMKNINVD